MKANFGVRRFIAAFFLERFGGPEISPTLCPPKPSENQRDVFRKRKAAINRHTPKYAFLAILGWAVGLGAVEPDLSSYVGPQSCKACHNQAVTKLYKPEKLDFCSLNEFGLSHLRDKHELAYDMLVRPNSLGQKMLERLGWKLPMAQERRCLSCHANWVAGNQPPPFFEAGVSCESCHGPGRKYAAPGTHDLPEWRKKPAADKRKSFEMVDVRNPRERARQCFGCHIGNVAEGKFITHEMYAAGHPPLPGIEIETFCNEMPKHWQRLDEKGPFQFKSEFLLANFPKETDPTTDHPRAQGVLIGGVMALRESVALFRDVHKTDPGPELAVYDCAACHHDLRAASWRQRVQPLRSFAARPGRPLPPLWSGTLAQVAARRVSQSAALEKLSAFQNAVVAKPFGDRDRIGPSADALIGELDQLAAACEQTAFGVGDARSLLRTLCESKVADYGDYHAARQIAWAIRIVYRELVSKSPSLKSQRFEDSLVELEKELRLGLPSGQQVELTKELPAQLQVEADFNPGRVRDQLKKLAEAWKDVK